MEGGVRRVLGRIEHATHAVPTKTRDGWSALCPAHADRKPSLHIKVGDDGRVLIKCFAGCSLEQILDALDMSVADLRPDDGTSPAAAARNTECAASIPALADWLLRTRGLSPAEADRMVGRKTRQGPAVVFRYSYADGRAAYEKVRPIAEKRFWRQPRGSASVLYGLAELNDCLEEEVIVTEGEMDVHALRSVGFSVVVSVPDGTGSAVTPELVAPLARFRRVLLAVDSDAPGDSLAARLATALDPERCFRVRFTKDGRTHKDANDALIAGWTRDDFGRAFRACESSETSHEESDAADLKPHTPYDVVDGCICQVRVDREGNRSAQRLANFAATVTEEVLLDDGAEVRRSFILSGQLASGTPLPTIAVPARDFASMGWVEKWGFGPIVYAGVAKRDHLRVAIQEMSTPTRHRVYGQTGWREVDGKWIFLHAGGAVGTNEPISVSLPAPLDKFALPDKVDDAVDAIRWSLRIFDCAPLEVIAPLMGAIYEAPLSTWVQPDFAVWFVGASGSYKSELTALAQRHFGAGLDRTNLPATWCSTEGSLENQLFLLKDVLLVIDDYPPQPDIHAQREQARRVERVIRQVGNRSSRGRLGPDLVPRPSRPPRGLAISSGEDLPPSRSIIARLVVVDVERDQVDTRVLTDLQKYGSRFAHAMRAYLEWLQPRLPALQLSLPKEVDRLRDSFQKAGKHARQAGSLAILQLGLQAFTAFATDAGAMTEAEAERLLVRSHDALATLGQRQGSHLGTIDPAERFVEVLREEIAQGRVVLLGTTDSPHELRPGGIEVIGQRDDEYAYLLPEVARRRVSASLREAGEAWDITAQTLHKALLRKGFVIPGKDGRIETQRRMGPTRPRVLKVPIRVFFDDSGSTPGSDPAPDSDESRAATEPCDFAGFEREIASPAPVAPEIDRQLAITDDDAR